MTTNSCTWWSNYFFADEIPVTLSSAKEFDLRDCTENEKMFRGTFHQNVRKIQNLKFPEAAEWMQKLGLDKNRSRPIAPFPVFVTAATSGYFDISQGVIKSVHELLMPKYPDLKLIYYGLDLPDHQINRVNHYLFNKQQFYIYLDPSGHTTS